MRKGLLAAGITAIIVGIIFIAAAATVAAETVMWLGTSLKTPNLYLLYSGVGLIPVGILLVILGAATSKKVPSAAPIARREAARAKAEEEIDIVKILKRSFKSLIEEPGFILLYLLPFAVLLIAFVHLWMSFGTFPSWTTIQNARPLFNFLRGWIIWLVVYFIGFLVLLLCTQAAIILKADARARGKEMGWGKAFTKGIRCFPRLLAALLLAGIIITWPLLLAIGAAVFAPPLILIAVLALVLIAWLIPMIYISIRLALFAQACVLENMGPVGCLKECWRMTKGNFWLIFVTAFLLGIVSIVIGLIPIVGSLIAMVLVGPAGIIAYTLIYLGLRKTKPIRK